MGERPRWTSSYKILGVLTKITGVKIEGPPSEGLKGFETPGYSIPV